MPDLKVGDKAPDFKLPTNGGGSFKLSDLKGQPVVVYFYPKDDTSGCTKEACSFTENLSAFNKIKAKIIGISKDSVASHDKFVEKYGLKFPLGSDEDGKVCEKYGTWVEKSMYGKKYMGIDRSTFLIDENGRIAEIWRKVKVPGHTEAVLDSLKVITKKAA
jgi:peroxiredoxin Q/BCP